MTGLIDSGATEGHNEVPDDPKEYIKQLEVDEEFLQSDLLKTRCTIEAYQDNEQQILELISQTQKIIKNLRTEISQCGEILTLFVCADCGKQFNEEVEMLSFTDDFRMISLCPNCDDKRNP